MEARRSHSRTRAGHLIVAALMTAGGSISADSTRQAGDTAPPWESVSSVMPTASW
jgi:hypothetical protein